MSKGLIQLKHRHAGQNERRAVWAAASVAYNKNSQIKRVRREDLLTGEITESSRSKMNAEIGFWFNTFEPFGRLALPQSLAWEELEAGALLFTARAKFWIENARPSPLAPMKPETKLCKSGACNLYGAASVKDELCFDCYEQAKSEVFYQAGEIERIYFDV